MRTIAVLTDAFEDWSLETVATWCGERGVVALELGVGGYSPAPHLDREALLAHSTACDEFQAELTALGSEVVALNASGNPLHPDPAVAVEHAAALRDAVRLAARLGVTRVVAMSGCPGGPRAGGGPVFAGGAWLPDMEGLWDFQWREVIAPYWSELSAWTAQEAPGVEICLELHPGTSIYNAASFLELAQVTDGNVRINLDPSHFWWQGIDPVATLEAVHGHVGFAHGKDTLLHPDRIALHGVLDYRWPADVDTMPWHFCAVGAGRSTAEWTTFLDALGTAGYEGPISIEHEDPNLTPEAGVEASLAGLRAALGQQAVPGGAPAAGKLV
jgi:sugar phosphate isomerase/epimerase